MARKRTTEIPSVRPALLKVDRAREHIDALGAAVHEYIEDPATFQYWADPDPGGKARFIAKVRVAVDPPPRLALICGDAVHNLRTALDYLVWQLGIADSGAVSDQSQFPLVDNADNWPSISGRTLALLSRDHVEEIRRLQIFTDASDNSPNVMLGTLGSLDNQEKHRLPLIVATAALRGTLTLGRPVRRLQLTTQAGSSIPISGETELFRLKAWGTPAELGVKAALEYGLAFGHERGPTVKMLRDLADMVAGVIGSFAVDIGTAAGARGAERRPA